MTHPLFVAAILAFVPPARVGRAVKTSSQFDAPSRAKLQLSYSRGQIVVSHACRKRTQISMVPREKELFYLDCNAANYS